MDIDIMANESGGCVDETRTPYAGAVQEDEIDKQPGKSRLLREKERGQARLDPSVGATPAWGKARVSDRGGVENRRTQRNRLMIKTESPNDTRPHGLGVPAHDADGR